MRSPTCCDWLIYQIFHQPGFPWNISGNSLPATFPFRAGALKVRGLPRKARGVICLLPIRWFPKIEENPQITHLFIGFGSIIFTIHFGVALFLETSIPSLSLNHLCQHQKQDLKCYPRFLSSLQWLVVITNPTRRLGNQSPILVTNFGNQY